MREFDLLRKLFEGNAALPPRVTIPPGDDMGAVSFGRQDVLVTVDQVADGVHFDFAGTSLERIARKAITRNLSDVAAMAALPLGAVAAVCLPRDFGGERAAALLAAMQAVGERFNCPVFGGDLSSWDHPLIVTVTVLAEAAGVAPVLRRGAQVGDAICVTGELGGSLECVDGRIHHLDFEPRLEAARALAADPSLRPHAMIDLSDGLARDLGHICTASGVSAQLWSDRLPLSRAAHQRARRTGQPAWRHALSDGEDYELCFTIPALRAAQGLPREIAGVPVTQVGVIEPMLGSAAVRVRHPDGAIKPAGELGWEHRGT